MKKRVLSAACAAVMAGILSISVPAGASDTESSKKEATAEDTDIEQQSDKGMSEEEKSSEGKVLNIYAWNEEFKTRMQ